ncbi:signal peptidase I [Clavibacter lycopersici]|uniref:Signal peptidase I n=1 Tax=Clavibacter lycopersici TaxID=2301718 RepID=A0A399TBE6_9MICO|nr:signal peptidase I [Clavibacter lycopersici]RIJ52569.1 signal peptidase I [Clavibacter lycopersici]RIJ62406.1 signal peptidase I [Clavibacter lycopersici]
MTDSTAPVETRSSGRHSGSASRGWKTFLRDVLVIFVVALLVSILIKAFLIRSFYIPSESMEDTLQVDDRIVVNQLTPRLIPLQRGDVVVFRDPGGWLTPSPEVDKPPIAAAVDWALTTVGLSASDSNDHLIKRLIGLPGDHVVCCNSLGQMSVNDVPLDEPYVKLVPGDTRASDIDFDVTVPADSLWVMGDNRDNSRDSRYNVDGPTKGFVPIDHVVGRAFVITWPIDRWSILSDHPETFGDVPDAVPAG